MELTRKQFLLRLAAGAAAAVTLLLPFRAAGEGRRDHAVAEHLFFRCKLLINPAAGTASPDAVIETSGGKILSAGPSSEVPIPAGAKVIDYGDKYVIPGLFDSHGHLYFGGIKQYTGSSRLLGLFYLAAGVTSVVNPGSLDPGGDMAVRQRIDEGIRVGPRFFNAANTSRWSPPPFPG